MSEKIVQWFADTLGADFPVEVVVFIISALPVLEINGGLIFARLVDMPLWEAFVIGVLGNMLPVPFILLFIIKLLEWMKKTPFRKISFWLERLANKNIEKLEKKAGGNRETAEKKYDQITFWGMVIFLALPFGGTGGWTGSLVAAVLHMKFTKALWAVFAGVLAQAFVMAILCYGVPELFDFFL
jgi:uncharacterized membrane protein